MDYITPRNTACLEYFSDEIDSILQEQVALGGEIAAKIALGQEGVDVEAELQQLMGQSQAAKVRLQEIMLTCVVSTRYRLTEYDRLRQEIREQYQGQLLQTILES